MLAVNRFKKDFGYYLLGIIMPGLLNAAMIPIIKRLLGTAIFGAYSLKLNFLLLLMATLIGGICQGIIRFKVEAENDLPAFYTQVFLLVRNLLMPAAIVCFIIFVLFFHQAVLLSLLFSFCVIGGSLQNILMAIAQANFQSKFILLSEGIRAFAFFAFSITVLPVIKSNQQNLLFLSLFLSYIISVLLLAQKNKLSIIKIIKVSKIGKPAFNTKGFLIYGFPISLWFAVYYLCTYLDKPLLAHDFGLIAQGNYQAMFDIIFRGITGIMSPFPIAALPILNKAFQEKKQKDVFKLLNVLILAQIAITIIGTGFYWFWGFNILASFLAIPFSINYKLTGLIMIVACMVWQIGFLNHKPFKLAKRTDLLLKYILISLALYLISFVIIRNFFTNDFYCYAWPFLISGISYNLLCFLSNKIKKILFN